MKFLEYQLLLRDPSPGSSLAVNALITTFSTLIGVIAYIANWIASGNRYRLAPFVMMTLLAFVFAATVRIEFDIIERVPVPRIHYLITLAIPIITPDLKPIVYRFIADIDRTGLPQHLTHSRPFVTAHSETTWSLLQHFWLLVLVVAIGNFYFMKRLAEDLAILGTL